MSSTNRKRSAPPSEEEEEESRPAQRRSKTEEGYSSSASDTDLSTLSYEWMPNDEAIRLRWGNAKEEVILRKGDTVRLLTTTEEDCWICRVEKLSDGAGGEPKFRGRWFYRLADVQDLLEKSQSANEEVVLQDLLARLKPGELVLSNLEEDNDISAIQHVCSVSYSAKQEGVDESRAAYFCRYSLDWDATLKSFSTREMQADGEMGASSSESSGERNTTTQNDTQDGDDEDSLGGDDDSISTSPYSHVIQEGEGGALRGDILVGEKHQVKVGPFIPNQKVASRHPLLLYKPGCMSEEDRQSFADTLAEFHTKYLQSHQLTTTDEPYTPLSSTRAEALLKEEKRLTGSHMSSAAVYMGSKRSSLRKECDVDAVLQVLAEHKHNKEEALKAIHCDPDFISNSWSPTEREIFDESYSRHQGALRQVAKALAPTKNMKQVIDYFYRFKIPDQFRMYQDKKRQQAIYLVECIEKRRGTAISMSGDKDDEEPPSTKTRWQETSVDEVARALTQRRQSAKDILLEIDRVMGKEVLTEIAVGIQKLHSSYKRETKEKLLRTLRRQPDLQRRLLEFLPRDV